MLFWSAYPLRTWKTIPVALLPLHTASTLKTSDDSVDDFEGKKIGSWGFGNEWEIFAAMAAEDLDAGSVEIVTQDFNMNAFLQKDIDAAQAMTYNEYAQLLELEREEQSERKVLDVPAGVTAAIERFEAGESDGFWIAVNWLEYEADGGGRGYFVSDLRALAG